MHSFLSSVAKLFLFLIFSTIVVSQTRQIDSLKQVLPSVSGKARLEVLYALSNKLEGVAPMQAYDYGKEGVSIAQELGDSASLATLYSSLAFSSSELGNFAQSLKYGYLSLEVSTKVNDKKKIASANSTLGIAYVYIGQYSKALEYHLAALRLREQLNLAIPTAATLNNIGILYHNIGQYDKAIEYYKRAQERHGAALSELGRVHYLTNIGYSEFKRGNFDGAMKYHTEALAIAEKSHYTGMLAYIYFNLGIMHSEKKDYNKALDYLHHSLSNYEELGQKYGIVQLLNALGTAYFKTAQYEKSIQYLDRAVLLSSQINAPDQLKISYENLYTVYNKTGPMSKAFQFYRLYSEAKDSLLNSNESKRIAEIVINHEMAQQQRIIELLQKEKMISELNTEKQNLQTKELYAGVIVSIVLIGYLIFNIRRTQSNKKTVEQKNKELKVLNDQLQQKIGEIQLLTGLLPICANCKKIRDDQGGWEQIEQYISKHSEVKFSHGICPDCMQALYGDVMSKYKKLVTL